jgi:VIT1/CCC1 family predicted Fe2+/Mn2+ transporter
MGFRLFLGSSAVEHSTVNRMVAGSNPARGASQIKHLAQNSQITRKPCVGTVLANQLPGGELLEGEIIMETIKAFFAQLFGSVIGIVFVLVGTLGWAYWMWMAIKLGSFGMFFFVMRGLLAMIAANA